jgi:hypothetical protein
MAKQDSIIKLEGKLGNKSYYYTKKYGYLVRKITSVNAERIRKDPAFARVRKNNTDFGRCALGVKLLRAAFLPMFADIADSYMTSRLTKTLMGVIQSDSTSAPGMRRLERGDLKQLRGFEFNNATSLTRILIASHATSVNLRESICTVTITPAAGLFVKRRKGATHFRILMGIAKIDFKTGAHTVDYIQSTEMSVYKDSNEPLAFTSPISRAGNGHLFVTLGVEYLQYVNGQFCVLQAKKYAALTLIHSENVSLPTSDKSVQGTYKHRVAIRRHVPKHSIPLRQSILQRHQLVASSP